MLAKETVKCSENMTTLWLIPWQGAIDKVKEGDKLVAAGKITPQDKVTMAKRASTMSYTLQGSAHLPHRGRGRVLGNMCDQ